MADMARTRMPYPSAQPVYAAARRWRDRSLLDDLSLFGPDLYLPILGVVVNAEDSGLSKYGYGSYYGRDRSYRRDGS